MYNIQKIIKTTALLAGLFGFVGCGETTCCESDVSVIESGLPTVTPKGEIKVEKEKDSEPPVVVANDNVGIIEIPPCSTVNFSSEGSYDPDGDDANLIYSWTGIHSSPMSNESSFDHKFGKKGLYEATLTVTDEQNLTAFERLCVLVGIDKSEIPLIADAGADFEVSGEQNVTISGRAVCRDESIGYKWEENGEIISQSPTFSKIFSEGSHELKLTIEDLAGNKTCDSIVVTVK